MSIMQNQRPCLQFIRNVRDIIDHYDIWLFDIVGIVHNGITAFSDAIATINELQKHKVVIFISNMPRPGSLSFKKLVDLGLQTNFHIMTSGDAVRLDLENKFKGKAIYHLGAERNDDILKDLNVTVVHDLKDAELVLLTQFIEQGEDLAQFDHLFDDIIARRLPVICANPDKIAMHGQDIRYCAGTFAARLESKGYHVEYYGKPNAQIYETTINTTVPKNINKSKFLMIGDTLQTDIQGAQAFGIDSLLVLTGNAAKEHDDAISSNNNEPKDDIMAYLKRYQQQHNICPTYVIEKLYY